MFHIVVRQIGQPGFVLKSSDFKEATGEARKTIWGALRAATNAMGAQGLSVTVRTRAELFEDGNGILSVWGDDWADATAQVKAMTKKARGGNGR